MASICTARPAVRSVSCAAALLALTLLSPAAATADVASGLVAYYPLDGDATDASGHGNHGTVMGPVATAGRYGDSAGALSFDGVDDVVEIPDSPDFDFNQPLTLTAWILLADSSPGGIVGQWGIGGELGDAFLLSIDDARLKASFTEPPLVSVGDPTPIASGTWRFVAMTYDGATVQLYLDGLPGASAPIAASPVDSGQPVRLGVDNIDFNGVEYLAASIDDVRIYNRALSSDDILELSNLVFEDRFESGDTSAWSAAQ